MILIKNAAFLNKVIVFDVVKFFLFFAFEKHAITILIHSTTIKNSKEEGKKYTWAVTGSELFSCIHTKSQLALVQFSIGTKIDNLGIFWKLFAAIANAAQLLQMLWTKIDVCNLKSIRPNLKSIGAEKSYSEKNM